MRSPDIEDLQLLDLSAAAPAYAPIQAPDGAVWPRAVIRFHDGWWTAKVWLSPGTPARRNGLLLAGMYSSRAAGFRYARQQVGILRMGSEIRAVDQVWSGPFAVGGVQGHRLPKEEVPC